MSREVIVISSRDDLDYFESDDSGIYITIPHGLIYMEIGTTLWIWHRIIIY